MTTYYVCMSGNGDDPTMASGLDWGHAYDSLADAITGGVSDGDVILLADSHDKNYGGAQVLAFDCDIRLVSVDESTLVYSEGAKEHTGGTGDFEIQANNLLAEGITFGGDTMSLDGINDAPGLWQFINCTLSEDEGAGTFIIAGDANYEIHLRMIGGTLDCNSRNTYFSYFETVHLKGVTLSSPGAIGELFNRMNTCICEDMDLSGLTTDIFTPYFRTPMHGLLRRCKLDSSVVLSQTDYANSQFTAEYCSDAELTATPLPLYKHQVYGGTAESISSVYRTNGASDGENNYCYHLAGDASNCSEMNPVDCPHPFSVWHNAAGSKTLKIFLASDEPDLTDKDVWAEISWNDEAATTYATGEFLTTRPTYGNELLAVSGSDYLKPSGEGCDWVGSGFTDTFFLEVSGINPAEPGFVTAKLFWSKADKDMWVCPRIELSDES